MISEKAKTMLRRALKANSINFDSRHLIDQDGNG